MLRWTLRGLGLLLASAVLMGILLWVGGIPCEGGAEPAWARMALASRRGGTP